MAMRAVMAGPVALLAILVIALPVTAQQHASPPAAGERSPVAWATPTEDVRGIVNRVLMILVDPNLKPQAKAKERRAVIRATVRERFNFAEMARRGLAGHWGDLTPAEQEHFVRVFTDLLEVAYLDKLEYLRDEEFVYTGERIDGDTATVNSKVVTRKNLEIPIDYKLFLRNGRWDVYDFLIDGVSLMNNYRQRFNKIIDARSYPELVRLMEMKLEKESHED